MCSISSTCSGLRPGLASKRCGDHAVAHHQDGVAEADRLLERVGGQDHADALVGQRADQLVDLLLGADVEAARRVVEDDDARPRVQPLGEHHLLLVAAGEVQAERIDARRADAQPLDPALREPALLAMVDQAGALDPSRGWRASCWRPPRGTAPGPRCAARAGRSRCRDRPHRRARRGAPAGRRPGCARRSAARSRTACGRRPRGRSRSRRRCPGSRPRAARSRRPDSAPSRQSSSAASSTSSRYGCCADSR